METFRRWSEPQAAAETGAEPVAAEALSIPPGGNPYTDCSLGVRIKRRKK